MLFFDFSHTLRRAFPAAYAARCRPLPRYTPYLYNVYNPQPQSHASCA